MAEWKAVSGAVLIAVLSVVLPPRAAGAAGGLPAFTNYVVDEAGVVPDDVEQRLDATLGDYQRRSTNQVAVAVVQTTGGRTIEDYSLALANGWGVGLRGKDNGVVIVIAMADRRVRIEVGRGLQAVLPNATAAGVVNDGLVQRLRQGDVGAAVVFATDSIRRLLGDTVVATTPATPPSVAPLRPTDPLLQPVPFQPGSGPTFEPGGRTVTETRGGFPWILLAIPALVVIAVVSTLTGAGRSRYRSGEPLLWGDGWDGSSSERSRRRPHGWGGGGWGGGGGFGGGFSSGSGGGFDGGGGGGFDGGGASGSW